MANTLPLKVVAACGVLALGAGFYFRAQRMAAQQSTQSLEWENAQLEAKAKATSLQRIKEDEAAAAERTAAAAKAKAADRPRESANDVFMREATENPELRQAMSKFFIAGFRFRYLQFARATGLSEAQMSQLGDAYFKRWSDQLDLNQAARLSGEDAARGPNTAFSTLLQKVSDAYDDAVRGVVGQAGFQQMQDFDRTYPARTMANQIAAGAAAGEAPLAPEQTEQIMKLIADGSSDYRQGGNVNVDKLDWDRVMAQAVGILSPAQMVSLNSIHAARDIQSLNALYMIDQSRQ